jgi:hypothetical protein
MVSTDTAIDDNPALGFLSGAELAGRLKFNSANNPLNPR